MKRFVAGIVATALAAACALPALADSSQDQWEQQVGQQYYQHLRQQGTIIDNSPYYATLDSIAQRIKKVADPQYHFPFHFFLVHDKQPNAYAVPGGNVYVTDSMMTFAKNKEELAGVLCHETSHDIHHDVYNLAVKQQRLSTYANLASVLFGGRIGTLGNLALGEIVNLQSLTFSRDVEHNADHKGAYTCAQAGIDPWGMVWLFQDFVAHPQGGAPPEALSDHPRDDHRISDLENEFAGDPATFACFNPDISAATPLNTTEWHSGLKPSCEPHRQASTPSPEPPPRAPVHTSSKGCPPGWKFCPGHEAGT